MIRDNRRRKKKRKTALIVFLTIVLVLGITFLVGFKLFTVTKVEVEGNKLYTDDQISAWVLDDEYSWNSLYVYAKYRFFDTQEVPFIDTMEVSLKPPHTIKITVYEKGLLGYLYMDSLGQNVYFDKDGFVVETSSDTIEGVPKITGLTCNEVVLYEKLKLDDKSALDDLLDVTQTLKKYSLVPDAIEYNKGGSMVLTYGTIIVNLGKTANLNDKVVRLEKIMPNLTDLSGTLHLEDWTQETTDITFEKSE